MYVKDETNLQAFWNVWCVNFSNHCAKLSFSAEMFPALGNIYICSVQYAFVQPNVVGRNGIIFKVPKSMAFKKFQMANKRFPMHFSHEMKRPMHFM
jgi:hypothetical protein